WQSSSAAAHPAAPSWSIRLFELTRSATQSPLNFLESDAPRAWATLRALSEERLRFRSASEQFSVIKSEAFATAGTVTEDLELALQRPVRPACPKRAPIIAKNGTDCATKSAAAPQRSLEHAKKLSTLARERDFLLQRQADSDPADRSAGSVQRERPAASPFSKLCDSELEEARTGRDTEQQSGRTASSNFGTPTSDCQSNVRQLNAERESLRQQLDDTGDGELEALSNAERDSLLAVRDDLQHRLSLAASKLSRLERDALDRERQLGRREQAKVAEVDSVIRAERERCQERFEAKSREFNRAKEEWRKRSTSTLPRFGLPGSGLELAEAKELRAGAQGASRPQRRLGDFRSVLMTSARTGTGFRQRELGIPGGKSAAAAPGAEQRRTSNGRIAFFYPMYVLYYATGQKLVFREFREVEKALEELNIDPGGPCDAVTPENISLSSSMIFFFFAAVTGGTSSRFQQGDRLLDRVAVHAILTNTFGGCGSWLPAVRTVQEQKDTRVALGADSCSRNSNLYQRLVICDILTRR
uniref:Acyl transferase domain-containing protein n=1 Tax=Macrostomum lignano TaxID=282301 RepID=A0A1I8FPJ2_9PLAT